MQIDYLSIETYLLFINNLTYILEEEKYSVIKLSYLIYSSKIKFFFFDKF